MAQYREGSITLSFGANSVSGIGTRWLSNVKTGDMLLVNADGPATFVASVLSDTELLLEQAWPGGDAVAAPYAIHRDFDPTTGAPLLAPGDTGLPIVFNRAISRLAVPTAAAVAGHEAVINARAARDATLVAATAAATDAAAVATDRSAIIADKLTVAGLAAAVAADKQTVLTARDLAAGSAAAALTAQGQVTTDRAATATALSQAQALLGSAGTGTATGLVYAALTKSLVTATDVVAVHIYDTRQDSDGGAWAARASGSWYWETLGTATRGVTRRFPALALLVLRSASLTIYDGHDLDATGVPRMWMVFNVGGTYPAANWNMAGAGANVSPMSHVCALHGRIWLAHAPGSWGITEIDFVADRSRGAWTRGGFYPYRGGIASRNAGAGGTYLSVSGLVGDAASDIYARVLPGGPLDSAGLPIPTVAVAMTTGVSVIHPWGAVYDITEAGGNSRVYLGPTGRVYAARIADPSLVDVGGLPYADGTAVAWRDGSYSGPGGAGLLRSSTAGAVTAVLDRAQGTTSGVRLLAEEVTNPSAGMIAHVATDFATGWMPGDIRCAWLCGTATGAISGYTILDTDLSSAAGWTLKNVTLNAAAGTLDWTGANSAAADYTLSGLVAGQTYVVEVSISSATAGALYIEVPLFASRGSRSSTGLLLASFTATSSSQVLRLTAGFSFAGAVTSVRVRLGVSDSSYKAKGLVVNGALSRTALSCGVAAFSDFSAGNYLDQEHNSDLDFGTGDFCLVVWLTHGAGTGTYKNAVRWSDASFSAGSWTLGWWTDNRLAVGASGANWVFGTDPGTGAWTHAVLVRRNGMLELWQDGLLVGSATWTANASLPAATLRVGNKLGGDEGLDGSIALVRITAQAPSPTQIRRMYEDERALIIGGTPAILGGTSNNVTALAANNASGTLSVGTSDGVSVFAGLGRVQYLDGTSGGAAIGNDAITALSASGPHLLIGTSANAGLISDGVIARDRLASAGPRPTLSRDQQVVEARGVTTDATRTVLSPRVYIGERESVTLDVTVQARTYGATSPQGGLYRRQARYIRDAGGNVTMAGSEQTIGTDQETTGGMDVTLQIDTASQTVAPAVIGVAGTRMVWTARIIVTRIAEDQTYAA